MKNILSVLTILFTLMILSGCNYSSSSPSGPSDGSKCEGGMVPEQPSYLMNVQPIFDANCNFAGCHGSNPPSGLLLTSYQNLMQGGVSGPPVIPGDAENSLLVKRIEGRIQPGMPLNRDPLCEFEIQMIRKWIDQGALNN